MRPPTRPAELLTGPFTVEQARAAGLTYRQLRGAAWRQVCRGIYVASDLPDSVQVRAAVAARVLPPDAVVGYTAAAWLLGADVRPRTDAPIEVIAQRGDQIRRFGTAPSSALLEPGDVVEICGVPVTSPTRTAFDLMRRKDVIEAVVGVDAMLNRGGCSLDEVAAYIADHRGWRGVRYAEAALAHAEPLSQSPMESRQRMRLVLAGLPRPQAQVPIVEADGHAFAYVDNGYEQWRVGLDYDGEPHRDRWAYDLQRQEHIRDLDWWHRRYTKLDIVSGWGVMVGQARRALLRAGWRPGAVTIIH